jgi:hypothetical protein
MSDAELRCLVLYLTGVTRNDFYVKLYGLLGEKVFAFVSLFQGKSIRMHNLRYLIKAKHYCKVFDFVNRRGDSEETRKLAAEKFKKRISHINSVVGKVNREMAKIREGKIALPKLEQMRKRISNEGKYRKRNL